MSLILQIKLCGNVATIKATSVIREMTMIMITNKLSFILTGAVVLMARRWLHRQIQEHKVRPQVCCGLHLKSAHGLSSRSLPHTVRSTATVGCFKMNLRVVVILLIFVHLYRFSFLRGCNVFVVQFWSDSEMTLSQVSLRSAFLVCHFSSICSTCSPRLKKQVGKCLQQSVWLSQTDWLGPSHAGLKTGWWPPVNHWLLGKNSFAMTRCKRLLVKPKSCRPRHWSGTHW